MLVLQFTQFKFLKSIRPRADAFLFELIT